MPFKTPTDLDDKYFDDFKDDKNFVQILFNPGKPVQARELTQLQSILQNQISKFSDHVFVDGAVVFGCKINFESYGFLRVKQSSIKNALGNTYSLDFKILEVCKNIFFKKQTELLTLGVSFVPFSCKFGGVAKDRAALKLMDDDFQIQVVDVMPQTSTDDLIIIFKFIKGSVLHMKQFTEITLQEVTTVNYENLGAIDTKVENGNPSSLIIRDQLYNDANQIFQNLLIENINTASAVNVTSGIVYKDGKFINVPESKIILYTNSETSSPITTDYNLSTNWRNIGSVNRTPTSNNEAYSRKLFSYPSRSVGFDFEYLYIKPEDDETLFDNSTTLNRSAPGADRLQFNITIKQYDISVSDPTFPGNYTEIIRIRGGQIDIIKTNIEKQYSEILNLFAKRTNDESGSYSVIPFLLDMKEHVKYNFYKLKFSSPLQNTINVSGIPEIGDYVFPNSDNAENFLGLSLKFNNENAPSKKYASDDVFLSSHIGEVVSVGYDFIILKQLTKLSWNLSTNVSIDVMYADSSANPDIINIGSLKVAPEFIEGTEGLYTTYDTPKGDLDKFIISVNSGRGYVAGFEQEIQTAVNIVSDKARGINHTEKSTSRIYSIPENGLIVEAGEDLFKQTGYENKLIDINMNAVGFKFLSTSDGLATGTIQEWVPFRYGISINKETNTSLVNSLNKESVIFISSENAPL